MNDPTLHDVLDRIDTGLGDHPDLVGIMAAGRRQRRRTRAAWAAAGAATAAAVVAPLAVLLGGTTTAPAGPGFAAEPTPSVSPAEMSDEEYESYYADQMTAAVTAAVPGARVSEVGAIDWWGFGWVWGQGYDLDNGVRVVINASHENPMAGEGRRTCDHQGSAKAITLSCEERVVGDQLVRVADVDYSGGKGTNLNRQVDVLPVDGSGPRAMVDAGELGEGASWAEIPSTDALVALVLDERIWPIRERGVIHQPTPEEQAQIDAWRAEHEKSGK